MLACDSYGNGTSTLGRHIRDSCKKYPGRVDLEKGQQILSTTGTNELVMVKWSQDACREAATEMIVMDELSFSFIERPGFRYFCKIACPRFEVPCRRTICKLFLEMYEKEKAELKNELKKHCLCLTTDTWTSVQNINYMVVTAHFIDSNWVMRKKILYFRVIANHNGITIGKLLETCLLSWEIERVLTISVDNVAANKVTLDYVREKMLDWEKPLVLNGKYMHIRCLAHIINLIVRSGLKKLEKSIAGIRNAIRYTRSSAQRLEAFKECARNAKVECKKVCILDVPTRWNSTYGMLDIVVEYEKAFDRLADEEDQKFTSYFEEEEDENIEEDELLTLVALKPSSKKQKKKRVGPPGKDDWERARVFVKFLKVFYNVTLRISASTKPTAQKAFYDIVGIKTEIDELLKYRSNEVASTVAEETQKILYEMAQKMKQKYNKYFGQLEDVNMLLLVDLVLNPRHKMRNFVYQYKKWLKMDAVDIEEKSKEMRALLVNLCDLYAESNNTQKSGSLSSKSKSLESTLSQGSKSSGKRPVQDSGIIARMDEDWERELEESDEFVVGHEVDQYIIDPLEKPRHPENFQVIEWWKFNGDKFPNLANLAKDIFAIQVSTVASECCFSTGRRVIDPFRSSLSPKTVEALICFQNWIKHEKLSEVQYVPAPEDMALYEDVEQEYVNDKAKMKGAVSEVDKLLVDPTIIASTSKSAFATKMSQTLKIGTAKEIAGRKAHRKSKK